MLDRSCAHLTQLRIELNSVQMNPLSPPEIAMNAPEQVRGSPRSATPRMTSAAYRESLRSLRPVVYVDGRRVESVADEAAFLPGINALGVSYDFAHDAALAPLM